MENTDDSQGQRDNVSGERGTLRKYQKEMWEIKSSGTILKHVFDGLIGRLNMADEKNH